MQVKVCDEIYAIKVSASTLKEGSEWIGENHEALQGQRMNYKKGAKFRAHFHILNPRTIKRTQEAFIVISGKIEVHIYDANAEVCGILQASAGEAIFAYRGGHSVIMLEDSVVYEVKAGQFSYVSEDKEFINKGI
jgi:hypothetical protein